MSNDNEKMTESGQEKKEAQALPAVQAQSSNSVIPMYPTKNQIKEYEEFLSNYDNFINSQLKEDTDFGKIPGVEKPSLLKPGAEKLEKLMFLTHEKVLVEKIVEKDMIKYTYRTIVYDKGGRVKSTCEGTCNSREAKYRYTWVSLNVKPSKEEADALKATGNYRWRKAGESWIWQEKQEKEDYYDIENTIMKMAQKRSYVGAILEATNSSGRFTQDVEDMAEFNQPAPASYPARVNTAQPIDGEVVYEPIKDSGEPQKGQPWKKWENHGHASQPATKGEPKRCQVCLNEISPAEDLYSRRNYGMPLCREHQKTAKKI